MPEGGRSGDLSAILRRALHPPLRERSFWAVQAMVVVIAAAHLAVDVAMPGNGLFAAGIPVALLIVPVGYAALRHGLAGAAATALWATLLWLPDLLLPRDEGHPGADAANLVLVDLLALWLGQRVEAEHLARSREEQATAERLAAEARYHQLFEATGVPILVVDSEGRVSDANQAASALFPNGATGQLISRLLGAGVTVTGATSQVVSLGDGREYRVGVAPLPAGTQDRLAQVILEDVTDERSKSKRASFYAASLLRAEEDQRQRLAREIHDEPLQLFLHMARRLESISNAPEVPAPVSQDLLRARAQALNAAARLRDMARDLRAPALDQLGLVPALSGLLADVEQDDTGPATELTVTGQVARLPDEIELGLFRIAQEAVRNAVAHAHAHHVKLAVRFETGHIVLVVTDDGCGFDQQGAQEPRSGHFGLLGMSERADLLQGQLTVRTVKGSGTEVKAVIPLEHDQPKAATSETGPPLAPGSLPATSTRGFVVPSG
ncbi:MAG: ATP-binding protein [Acidimicrobiales bacterium]